MSKEFKLFDPKSLGSEKILLLKLKDVEIEKEDQIDKNGKVEDIEHYVVDFEFENIFGINEFSSEIEAHFDNIYETVLKESGLYLENITIEDQNRITAWGIIYKKEDKYFVCKPDSIE